MCRLSSHLSKHPWPYITSCCHCIITTHYDRKQKCETSAGTVTTRLQVHSDSTFSHFIYFIGLSRKWSLSGKAISWEWLCFKTIAFRLIFYKLFWSVQEIVLTNPCGASAGRLQTPPVNILLAVFAKQSHYIFRDGKIFFMAGKMSMINWTINTLIQQHKSAQRHNTALNMT